MLDAASRGPTAIDEATGSIYVLRHRDIERLLNEPRVHGVGLSLFDAMAIAEGPLRDWYGALMFTNDGARHDRLRRLVSKAFTPRAVGQLRPIAARRVAEQLSSLRQAGGGDLVAALAHVPMHVMCALVGIPAAAVPDFIAWVDALSPVFGFMEPEQIARAETAITDLLAYVRALTEERSHDPTDDLMSALIRAEHDGDRLTRDETVTMVANLLVGGHDTTASQIGCTLLTLLARPSALAEIRSEPALVPAVVSETIRFEPSITSAPRTVVEPIEICGIERPAGAIVMCTFLTANRDPAVWHEPESFISSLRARRRSKAAVVRRWAALLPGRSAGPDDARGVGARRRRAGATLAADPQSIDWCQVLGRSPARLPVTI